MTADVLSESERRVLILPPTRRDGEITRSLLSRAGLVSIVCSDLGELTTAIEVGAAAVLIAENAIPADRVMGFVHAFGRQPSWSDIPVIVLMHGGSDSAVRLDALKQLSNLTLLERPAPMRSVVSAVQAAVRGRERQYQIRDQFAAVRDAEARARDLQEQLEIALDASELGTFHCAFPLGRIVWNARCKSHFFLPADAEVDFDLFYARLHPDDRERTRQAIDECVNHGKHYDIEYRTVSPEGRVRWIRATGRTYFDALHNPIRFDGTTQDVTKRKEAEAELLESQSRFLAMANSIPQLAWMARADGWLFWYNKRWHDYCGTTSEQMEGWGWQSVHDPEHLARVTEKWKACIAAGEPWEDTFPSAAMTANSAGTCRAPARSIMPPARSPSGLAPIRTSPTNAPAPRSAKLS